MPAPTADALLKSMKALLAEKRAVEEKEKALVGDLNRLLAPLGYAVVTRRHAGSPGGAERAAAGQPSCHVAGGRGAKGERTPRTSAESSVSPC